MKHRIKLGISPCPNDTFIFYALINRIIPTSFDLDVIIKDVEELNNLVLKGRLDVSKVSYHLAGLVRDRYHIMDVGGALGWGCGPLVVKRARSPEPLGLKGKKVAIPGHFTTAHLLLRLYEPDVGETEPMLFSDIPECVARGEFEAGVIIHESRFTYKALGLECMVDLGHWWEQSFGLPIPLGGIVVKKEVTIHIYDELRSAIQDSLSYARANTDEVIPFMKKWAKEMDEAVMMNHVRLYVNDFSMELGETGQKAVDFLFQLGIERGLFPKD